MPFQANAFDLTNTIPKVTSLCDKFCERESRILFVRSEAGMLRPCGQTQSQDPKSDAQHLKELTGNVTACISKHPEKLETFKK